MKLCSRGVKYDCAAVCTGFATICHYKWQRWWKRPVGRMRGRVQGLIEKHGVLDVWLFVSNGLRDISVYRLIEKPINRTVGAKINRRQRLLNSSTGRRRYHEAAKDPGSATVYSTVDRSVTALEASERRAGVKKQRDAEYEIWFPLEYCSEEASLLITSCLRRAISKQDLTSRYQRPACKLDCHCKSICRAVYYYRAICKLDYYKVDRRCRLICDINI